MEEIDRDIGRTFPEHYFFKEKNGPGQIALRNVLLGIAALNPQLGYCQGINFLVGMLVMYCNDEVPNYLPTNLRMPSGL